MTTRVALIGANGYGLHHRHIMAPLVEAGRIDLVGLCDLRPIHDEPGAPVPAQTQLFTDFGGLLDATAPDVVIIATPPHTHLQLATAATRTGADVLVEKPPFMSMAEHAAFTDVIAQARRVCQVGFQALGSAALTDLVEAIRDGRLGKVAGIGAYGAWQRPDSYYERAPWAGRRVVAGRPVLDGVLVNPFAHALMQSLAVAEALGPVSIASVELERFRARPIDVDDTAAIRVRLGNGLPIVVAATLCADEVAAPVVVVHGERGDAVLEYTTDTLHLQGEAARVVPGRAGLLENLLDHRDAPTDVPLVAALARTAPFTELVQTNLTAAPPDRIAVHHLAQVGTGAERIVTVKGVTKALRDSIEQLMLPSELGAPWAITAT